MISLEHRQNGYRLVSGNGLEIGALHEPAALPAGAKVSYFDAITKQEAEAMFAEIPAGRIVHVDHLGDLDNHGLAQFKRGTFDFVIITHVLEHVSNPVGTVAEVFRILRPGGVAVIAIPDKDYTFDRGRKVTDFDHLWSDFIADVRSSDDGHYLDFLQSAAPHVFLEPPENLAVHIARARTRREHAHVWDSAAFRRFLEDTMICLRIRASRLYESVGSENSIEYFSAWRKE